METAGIFLLVGVVVLLLLLVFKRSRTVESIPLLELKEAEHNKAMDYLRSEKLRIEDELSDLRRELERERIKVVQAEEALRSGRERLVDQEKNISELNQKFKLEFEHIANKILDEKSAKFTVQNKENLDIILNPLKENIRAFEEKVEKVYKDESAERNKLEGVLKEMMDQSKLIREDANNLTKALKGDSKKQGNWGEVILERVLERSGLIRDREYRIQANLSSEDGGRFHPDVIIDLPDEKNLIVDSKISLVAYERLVNAENEQEKTIQLKLHLQSIKTHIDSLSGKQYQNLYSISSPDFVLLFMPIESSFSVTVQADHDIFNYAWDKKVVIVSPTTLLATLRTIASIWKVDRQNKNVVAIAEEAGSLYD
ncbi:MAG: DNA recombination protein RmuC, partial [Sphingobacteriales bacterium]